EGDSTARTPDRQNFHHQHRVIIADRGGSVCVQRSNVRALCDLSPPLLPGGAGQLPRATSLSVERSGTTPSVDLGNPRRRAGCNEPVHRKASAETQADLRRAHYGLQLLWLAQETRAPPFLHFALLGK